MFSKEDSGRRFYDIEEQEEVTEKELRWQYEWLVASGQTEQKTFGQYLAACLDGNGSLIEIYRKVV